MALIGYDRLIDFSQEQASAPLVGGLIRGDHLDSELDAIEQAIDSMSMAWTGAFEADGALKAGTVGAEQLNAEILASLISDVTSSVQPSVDAAAASAVAADLSAQEAAADSAEASASAVSAGESAGLADASEVATKQHMVAAQTSAGSAQTSAEIAVDRANWAEQSANAAAISETMSYKWAEHLPDAVRGTNEYSAKYWANYTQKLLDEAGLGDLKAVNVEFTPVGDISSVNVQDAIAEVEGDYQAADAMLSARQDQAEAAIIVLDSRIDILEAAPPPVSSADKVTFASTANVAAGNVQDAIVEVDTEYRAADAALDVRLDALEGDLDVDGGVYA